MYLTQYCADRPYANLGNGLRYLPRGDTSYEVGSDGVFVYPMITCRRG